MAYVRQHPTSATFRIKVGVMPEFSGANQVSQETPSGDMDGVNKEFQLAYIPIKDSEQIFKDGMMMARASSFILDDGDYFLDFFTGKITFSNKQVPQVKSIIRVNYKYIGQA